MNIFTLKKRAPFFLCISVTSCCENNCKYCKLSYKPHEEMSTKEIFHLLDQCSKMGTKTITLTGGNPLLRRDIGEIINYIKSKGLKLILSLNGSLVSEKRNEVRKADLLQLSFDGPPEVNDSQRYKGAYKHFIQAMEVAKIERINFIALTVLTKNNINFIEYVADFAYKNRFFAFFQVVDKTYFLKHHNPSLELSKNEYMEVVKKLIQLKKRNRYIGNSSSALNFMYRGDKNYKCFGGKYFALIHSNGDVYPCWTPPSMEVFNWREEGFLKSFYNMPTFKCNNCQCISCIELNYLYALKIEKLYDTILKKIIDISNEFIK